METLLEILRKSEAFLAAKGIPEPRLDAEHLLASALSCRRMDLYLQFDRPMTDELLAVARPLIARRGRREPLSHILGQHPFHGLDLHVGPAALIPRPETEQLVEVSMARVRHPPTTILDLGTGSGAIALALKAACPAAAVTGVDRSEDALALARSNGERLNLEVEWKQSDWFEAIDDSYDLIISNPPYLGEDEWRTAEAEVREHEPRCALVAEQQGLADLLHIVAQAPPFLNDGGLLALETGPAQHAVLIEQARKEGYAEAWGEKDLQGRDRFVFCSTGRTK